ncbi:MAG: helix-turn-helix domain-containing protein [Christensenellales bacterium]|jgi:AraC-like DNA-binding protein
MLDSDSLTVTGIDMVVRVTTDRAAGSVKRFGPRRYHGLVCQLGGASKYVVDGKEALLNEAGNILYLEEGVPYNVYGLERSDCIAVNFHLCAPSGTRAFLFKPRSFGTLRSLFFELLTEWNTPRAGHVARCLSTLYRIMALMDEQYVEQLLPVARLREIQKVGEYMEAHYGDAELSVEEAMRQAKLGRTHLRNQFGQVYGMTPRQYLTNLRIARAKELLTATDDTVTEIARRCGYDSLYSFSRSFSRETGYSPTDYRKEYFS